MQTTKKKNHSGSYIFWPKHIGYLLIFWAIIQTFLYQYLNLKWIAIPWIPVAIVGISSLIIFSLKNLQIQRRLTKTNFLWNTITNSSSEWETSLKNTIPENTEANAELKNRHLAWLIMLRFQLNQKRSGRKNDDYHKLHDELNVYIPETEIDYVFSHKNSAKQLIALQSFSIKELYDNGKIGNHQYLEILRQLADYYDLQVQCEKTNNYSDNTLLKSASLFLIRLFIILLPFGLINEFQKIKNDYVLLTIPLCILISAIFIQIERNARKADKSLQLNFGSL